MKVHWGESKNWMILHDLRIEHGGLVAQIDHLLINRWLEMWVCESKRFSEGVAINEYGEFSAFFGGKPYGVPSPIEQNNKHILILERFFNAGGVRLPTRLGFTIKPTLNSLVLVSKHARISRPKIKIQGMDSIIKNDQIFKFIDKSLDQNNNPLLLAKLVSQDTLVSVSHNIAQCHKPIQWDWAAKFGFTKGIPIPAEKSIPSGPFKAKPDSAQDHFSLSSETNINNSVTEQEKPKQKLVCYACGASITYNVAKFCWFNKQKFGGNIYCMACQKSV